MSHASTPAFTPVCGRNVQLVARFAVRSLHAELVLYPKPGLVSPFDSGSHVDMDATTFMRSLFSLRGYFQKIAAAGAAGAGFESLVALGISAEGNMLTATGGVNTHRGAIFCMGMACAAAARAAACSVTAQRAASADAASGELGPHGNVPIQITPANIRTTLLATWGDALAAHCHHREHAAHGTTAMHVHGAGGARAELAAGMPSVFDIALPTIEHALSDGRGDRQARIDAFFALMANVEDTNVYHRGGAAGTRLVREAGAAFVARGGTGAADWHACAVQVHEMLVAKHLSPGGVADLLAVAILVRMLTAPRGGSAFADAATPVRRCDIVARC